jgi:hypothetical protein
MDDDFRVAFELSLLMSKIKKGTIWCARFFPLILKKYEKKNSHHVFPNVKI